jgi:hypothetical protein
VAESASSWARVPALPALPPAAATDGTAVVAGFRAWSERLMAGAGETPTVGALSLRKLRLTDGYREALRQAPGEQAALFAVWDAAYRVLELLHWELAPPAIDPPPPTFDEVRRQYKAMKRERERETEARSVHWHPMEVEDGRPEAAPDAAGG